MELYEALRNGTSKEELTKTFEKELNEALKRVEKEQEFKKNIVTARTRAAKAIHDYISALLMDKDIEDFASVSKIADLLWKAETATKETLEEDSASPREVVTEGFNYIADTINEGKVKYKPLTADVIERLFGFSDGGF